MNQPSCGTPPESASVTQIRNITAKIPSPIAVAPETARITETGRELRIVLSPSTHSCPTRASAPAGVVGSSSPCSERSGLPPTRTSASSSAATRNVAESATVTSVSPPAR